MWSVWWRVEEFNQDAKGRFWPGGGPFQRERWTGWKERGRQRSSGGQGWTRWQRSQQGTRQIAFFCLATAAGCNVLAFRCRGFSQVKQGTSDFAFEFVETWSIIKFIVMNLCFVKEQWITKKVPINEILYLSLQYKTIDRWYWYKEVLVWKVGEAEVPFRSSFLRFSKKKYNFG